MITTVGDHSVYECQNIYVSWSKTKQCSPASREITSGEEATQIKKRRPFTTHTLATLFPRFSWTSVTWRSSRNSPVERLNVTVSGWNVHVDNICRLFSWSYWNVTGILCTVNTQHVLVFDPRISGPRVYSPRRDEAFVSNVIAPYIKHYLSRWFISPI